MVRWHIEGNGRYSSSSEGLTGASYRGKGMPRSANVVFINGNLPVLLGRPVLSDPPTIEQHSNHERRHVWQVCFNAPARLDLPSNYDAQRFQLQLPPAFEQRPTTRAE